MNACFQPYIGKFVLVYLDDIIVFSKTPQEHEEHLRAVFQVLRDQKLYAKQSKCEFNRPELRFLGMIVGRDGLKVDEAKVAVVRNWPVPQEVSALRGFLGLANYFRKFIQGYSSLVAPLTALTGSAPWQWGEAEQKAFDGVKEALTNAPVLALPNVQAPFQVITDASLHGTGAVLMQDGRPVAYQSSKFSSAERNYTTTEQEMLGVINALKEWRCYLEGPPITLVTDHNPNTYLEKQRDLSRLSRRQVRWLEYLSRFHHTWEYRPGRTNVADPISRIHAALARVAASTTAPYKSDLPTLIQASYISDQWLNDPQVRERYSIDRDIDGIYRHKGKIYVPDQHNLRSRILSELHDAPHAGHRGSERTLELVGREFWWPGLPRDVRRYVASCPVCQRNKPSQSLPGGLLQPLPIPEHVWQAVSMDFVTSLPESPGGNNAIVVFVDRLSKMCRIAPTTDKANARTLAQLYIDNVVRNHGFATEVLSDRGSQFISHFWQEVVRITGAKQYLSSSYHPQTDGQTERVNRIIQEILRNYVSPCHRDWDTKLSLVEFAYNNTYQAAIKSTPFFLNYGRHPRLPTTLGDPTRVPAAGDFCANIAEHLDRAKRFIKDAQERYKHYANKQRRDATYTVGQKVLLSTRNISFRYPDTKKELCPKLLPRFMGPFTVTKLIGPTAVQLALPQHFQIHNVFHVSLIKPYNGTRESEHIIPTPAAYIDGTPQFAIDKIIGHREVHRGTKTIKEYLVQWEGCDATQATYEPESTVPDIAIDMYWMDLSVQSERKRKALSQTAGNTVDPAYDPDTICEVCGRPDVPPTMVICDGCDKGYHLKCLKPRLLRTPVGRWLCPSCRQPPGHH